MKASEGPQDAVEWFFHYVPEPVCGHCFFRQHVSFDEPDLGYVRVTEAHDTSCQRSIHTGETSGFLFRSAYTR